MLRYVLRAILATALMFGVSTLAVAQYGGGGGMGGGVGCPEGLRTRLTAPIAQRVPSLAVAGGAAAGAGVLYWMLHSRALEGCVSGDGDRLVNEKDSQTYSLTNKQSETLKPGERVELLGKKVKNDSGEPIFEVHKM